MPIRPAAPPDSRGSLFSNPNEEERAGVKSGAWILAHCDGGARGNPGPAGYGALIQSEDGVVLAELSEFLGYKTNNFAEYSGLLGCLQYALDHGYGRLRLVSDSELMVKQIQGKYQVKSADLKPLFEEAKRRIAKLNAFEISHALRHKNKDADRLANEAMDRGMNRPGTLPSTAKPTQAAKVMAEPVIAQRRIAPPPAVGESAAVDAMLRGFTRDGVVHVLGGEKLPDGIFVKIIRE